VSFEADEETVPFEIFEAAHGGASVDVERFCDSFKAVPKAASAAIELVKDEPSELHTISCEPGMIDVTSDPVSPRFQRIANARDPVKWRLERDANGLYGGIKFVFEMGYLVIG